MRYRLYVLDHQHQREMPHVLPSTFEISPKPALFAGHLTLGGPALEQAQRAGGKHASATVKGHYLHD